MIIIAAVDTQALADEQPQLWHVSTRRCVAQIGARVCRADTRCLPTLCTLGVEIVGDGSVARAQGIIQRRT